MSLSSENPKKSDAGGGFLFLFFVSFVYPKFQSIPLYRLYRSKEKNLNCFFNQKKNKKMLKNKKE